MAHGENGPSGTNGTSGTSGTSGPRGPPGPVSFGFSRTAGRRRLAEAREGSPEQEQKDFVRSVEDRELRSTRPAEAAPRELVIPLLRQGHGRRPALPEDGVLRQAVEELIEEARGAQGGSGAEAAEAPNAIPLPARAPEGPEAAGADYEAVPVEAYGLAMLRGMGWKPGEGIGRTFKQVVKPREDTLRPKGLGLGASLAAPPACPDRGLEEPAALAPGKTVLVLAGPHRGLRGRVQALDPDNARAVVELAPGRVATLSEHVLRPVQRPEPEPERPRESEGRKRPRPPAEPAAPWLRRDLRVRCVDRRLHGGRYYRAKMTVEDVLGPDVCVCRTDEGRLLEGLRESMLETLIPREEHARVMVVLGPHRGRLGRLLARDTARARALVQLQEDGDADAVLQLDYEAVCEYVGPASED